MEAIKEERSERKAIVEDLIYENTCVMISAEPGCGKSTIVTQMMVEIAAGLPVFSYFPVVKPVKVLYAQTERNIMETLERLNSLSKSLPINKDNLVITDEYQKLDMLNKNHADILLECILRDCPDVGVIILDPIYSMVSGGLKEDKPASALTKALSLIEKETSAALWLNHHTTKPQHSNKGHLIEREDPFYGSQWLKAHVTGSYYMSEMAGVGVLMKNKKDNYAVLAEQILLEYNKETGLCNVKGEQMLAIDKVKRFLRAKEVNNEEFYFKDIEDGTELCTRTLRKILMHSSIKDSLIVVSSYRNKNLYRVSRGCF